MGKIVALCGNPNTGKSTIFNALTGLKQHTGNWSGKTVGTAVGFWGDVEVVDLPGMYSLTPKSEDEARAVEFLRENKQDLTVVVTDATCFERNLILALEILDISKNNLLCINMTDEAEKKGIKIDFEGLERKLGVRVIPMAAGRGMGIEELKRAIKEIETKTDPKTDPKPTESLKDIQYYIRRAAEIYKKFVRVEGNGKEGIDRKIDRILLSEVWGIPIILGVFGIMLWITVVGANYPSAVLQQIFGVIKCGFKGVLCGLSVDKRLVSLIVDGVYSTVAEVVAVMLPPMAIFFPLFTILEDLGFLPRIAFNLDRFFRRAGTNGRQALCMCMGIGCNAAGVISARIIESPKEKRAAILTNVFMPCNGRFPLIIIMSGLFFSVGGFESLSAAAVILGALVFGVAMTLAVTRFLMRGEKSSFILELPPYRRPQIGQIIIRSLKDRTLFVLGRAVMAAAPAGAVIWFLQNVSLGGTPLIGYAAAALDCPARAMGLDGSILTGFLLGIPANEIVLPLILMIYGGQGDMKSVLLANGWGIKTALCMLVFCICHFPCATTLMTIKKETGSVRDTVIGFMLPTVCGVLICIVINMLFYVIN